MSRSRVKKSKPKPLPEPDDGYNDWTIIKPDEDAYLPDGRRYICQCICGVVKSVRLQHLENNTSKSCGCNRAKRGVPGAEFNDLTLVEPTAEFHETKHGRYRIWKIACSCGQIIRHTLPNIMSGRTKTCGNCDPKTRTNRKRDRTCPQCGEQWVDVHVLKSCVRYVHERELVDTNLIKYWRVIRSCDEQPSPLPVKAETRKRGVGV